MNSQRAKKKNAIFPVFFFYGFHNQWLSAIDCGGASMCHGNSNK